MLVNFYENQKITLKHMYGKLLLFSYRVFSKCSVLCYEKHSTNKLLEFLAKMPKDTALKVARTNAQRQRNIIAKKYDKYAPGTVYLQVLGSGAIGVPSSLYLFTDQKRYLFNCGEGTQRLAHEHKVKLSRLENIFITSKTWKHIGGLPGLSLTLQDVGVPHITLHGPEGLDELYTATERFIVMKDMNVKMAACSPSEDYEDSVMTVKYIHQGPTEQILVKETVLAPAAKKPKLDASPDKEFEEFMHDDTDYYMRDIKKEKADKNKNKSKDVKEKIRPKTALTEKDPLKKKTEKVLQVLQKRKTYTVSYICTLKKRLGTLDLNKCVDLGVKPGPLLGKLKNGEDVVLPDGTLVLSKDVKTPDDPGPVFIVLDVPEITYLKEGEFSAHFDNGVNPSENIPTVIVHYSPPDVLRHPTYQAFMTMFGPTTQHLIINSQNSCLGSEAVHRTQHKLHLLDNDIFPLLKDISIPAEWNTHPPVAKKDSPAITKALEDLKNKIALAQFQSIMNMEGSCKGDGALAGDAANQLQIFGARSLTMYHLRPKKQDRIDRSTEPKLHIKEYIEEAMNMDGFTESLEKFRQLIDNVRYNKGSSEKEYPKIVFLGTGSCIPSKTRNTSAIVVHLNEQCSMLLDCSEGTFSQMVRFYGPKQINSFLRTLKAIYVSHLHADHHIGLIGVLQARRHAFKDIGTEFTPDPVYLLAPGQIMSWLSIYDLQFEKIRGEFTLIPNQDLLYNLENPKSTMTSAVLANIGVEQIRTCQVWHCPNAFGVAIQVDGQYKITYSGDTIPCDELVKIGENSTVLIHEATMEDELAQEARFKMHSTTSQAIDVGRQMCARHTVLTHFSQRYARLPRLNQHILNDNNAVGIAFDNMQITMSDLELLPHMYAPLQLMFAEHCLELELRAELRSKKEQLRKRLSLSSSQTSVYDKEAMQKVRNVSPGCRTAMSAPTSHAKYRESNASRLRQELKGMTISGTVGRTKASPKLRSKSLSPSKLLKLQQEPSARSQTQSIECNPPQKVQERSESNSNASSRIVIDSLSRTITDLTSGPRQLRERSKETNGPCKKLPRKPESSSTLSIVPDSGYGKPLVTPVNTKLVIRRDRQYEQLNIIERLSHSANASRARTPVRSWKAQKGTSSLPTSPKRPYISNPKSRRGTNAAQPCEEVCAVYSAVKNINPDVIMSVLIHIILWKVANITSCLWCLQQHFAIIIIAAGVLFWTANKAFAGHTRHSIATNVKTDKPPEWKNKPFSNPIRLSTTSLTRNNNRSPLKQATSLDIAITHDHTTNMASYSRIKSPKSSRDVKSWSPELPKNVMASSFRDTVNENIRKKSSEKDKHIPLPGRPSLALSSHRSFRPQLEDIQSSYLLLNKVQQEKNAKAKSSMSNNKRNNMTKIPRSMPVNEQQRREKLHATRKKYQSKEFWNESRYDKIEGLNWISWK